MNKEHKKQFANNTERLERELTSLERNLLKTLQERAGDIQSVSSSKSAEFMDTVSNSELDEMAARIMESDSTKIDEIEEALQRLRNGKYGICSHCGECISKKRLKARPFATLCLTCKEKAEKNGYKHKGSGQRNASFGGAGDLETGENGGAGEDSHSTMRGNKL